MLVTDKNIKSLIKKIQKKCEKKVKVVAQVSLPDPLIEENKETSDMFREMKKLPFSE
jgi:hypothetical protein